MSVSAIARPPMGDSPARAKAKETAWRLAALALGHPSPEFHGAIASGEFHAAFGDAWADVTGTAWSNPGQVGDFAGFEAGYIEAFLHGRGGKPTAALLAGDHEDILAGLTRPVFMLNLAAFYKHFGLKVVTGDEGKNDEPDHVASMLELMAVLCHLEAGALQKGRDAYKHDFVHHLIGSFEWSPLDYLVVDMPPGTGNELITLCDMLEGSNVSAVLVTTPQAVAQMDSLKAGQFCNERGLPVIGAVSNMAGVVCPHCETEFHVYPDAGLADALEALDIPLVAQIPLSPELALASDTGAPVVANAPESRVAQEFAPLIDAVAAVGREDFGDAVARTLEDIFDRDLADDQLQAALEALPPDARAGMSNEIAALLGIETQRLTAAAKTGGVS